MEGGYTNLKNDDKIVSLSYALVLLSSFLSLIKIQACLDLAKRLLL